MSDISLTRSSTSSSNMLSVAKYVLSQAGSEVFVARQSNFEDEEVENGSSTSVPQCSFVTVPAMNSEERMTSQPIQNDE